MTPRVGKYQITNAQILADLQRLFPDKLVISAVACRGTDRTLAPPVGTVPRLTPFRKALMIIRSTGEVKFETHWEKWQDLSNRQLIRPAHSCRLNVTMFARDREPVMTGDSQSSQSVQPDVPVAGEPVDSLPQSQDTTRAAEVRPIEQNFLSGLQARVNRTSQRRHTERQCDDVAKMGTPETHADS